MKLDLANCSKCDCGMERYIVNKKHYLCQEKNYIRLHGSLKKTTGFIKNKKKDIQTDTSELKKKYSIKKISCEPKYRCSDGTMVSQVYINRKYAECIDKIKNDRPSICEGTGRSDMPLSFSHTISRSDCKKLNKAELIWDPLNIEIESFHERSSNPYAAHNIWEDGSLDKKKTLLNFQKKIDYIKKNAPKLYNEKYNE